MRQQHQQLAAQIESKLFDTLKPSLTIAAQRKNCRSLCQQNPAIIPFTALISAILKRTKRSTSPPLSRKQITLLEALFDDLLKRMQQQGHRPSDTIDINPNHSTPDSIESLPGSLPDKIKLYDSLVIKYTGAIPPAPTVHIRRSRPISRHRSNASMDPRVEKIQLAAEKYLDWMSANNITGTRFFTRFRHLHHGDSGRRRVQKLLHMINEAPHETQKILKQAQQAFQQSSRAEHAFSRFLYTEFGGDNASSAAYAAYKKDFDNIEVVIKSSTHYVDLGEAPDEQYDYLKNLANDTPESFDLFDMKPIPIHALLPRLG